MDSFPEHLTTLLDRARYSYRTTASSPINTSQASQPISDEKGLIAGLEEIVQTSLSRYLYSNAVFYAERLYSLSPAFRSLHLLGHCYFQKGDANTTYRLLSSHYPFFTHTSPPATNRFPSSGSPDSLSGGLRQNIRSPPATAKRWESQTLRQQNLSQSPSKTDLGLSHEYSLLDDLSERWKCQYLLGVSCCSTDRHAEGIKIFDELRRIPQIKIPDLSTDKYAPTAAVELNCLLQEYDAEIKYWYGVCENHLHRDSRSDTFGSAYHADPLLFCAFEEYVRTTWKPPQDCLRCYQNSSFSDDARALSSIHADAPNSYKSLSSENSSHASSTHRKSSEHRQLVKQYIAPFAVSTYLIHSYRCLEAQEYLMKNIPAKEHKSGWFLANLGLARFHDGNMKEASSTFEEMLEYVPWRLQEPALVYYSTALWQLKDQIRLGGLAQRLIEDIPKSPVTLCVVANMYSLSKEQQEAIVMLNRAIQVSPMFSYAYSLKGYELLYLDQNSEAGDAFKSAISVSCTHYIAYAGLGELYVRNENVDCGRKYFELAIALNPLPTIINRYAATFHRCDATEEDLKKAKSIYEEAIKRHPNNLAARHQRAEVLLRFGQWIEAAKILKELIIKHPNEATLHVTLARCHLRAGKKSEAVKNYHDAMSIDPRREGYIKNSLENINIDQGT